MKNYKIQKPEEINVQEERAAYGKEKPKAKDTARLIWASKPKKEPNAKELEFQTAEEVYPNIADVKDKKLLSFVAEKSLDPIFVKSNGKKVMHIRLDNKTEPIDDPEEITKYIEDNWK